MEHRDRILLEVGNTTVKLARSTGGGGIIVERYEDPEEVAGLLDGCDAEIVCVPVGSGGNLPPAFHDLAGLRVMRRADLLPFAGSSYASPETLGLDRILNLAGLAGQGIAISCGTAITIDAMTPDGPFWGAIMPGFGAAALGLHDRIPVLPLVSADALVALPARTSLESVANGVLLGTALAVAGLAGRLAALGFPGAAPRVVVTGGDGELLLRYWNDVPAPELDAALLFRGMLRMLEKQMPPASGSG